ncbi:unnamed protein product [Prorocentrum cordatum]|uniref:Uncharacterized protein n=1 Tax=Prorocentrum cordatum TaxID=2364126 RepID=A0ABN9PQM9_9DINO|nr:unnamed protein product [Polarella glacialis]
MARRTVTHRTLVCGLRAAACDPAPGSGGAGPDGAIGESPYGALLFHHHGWAKDRARRQKPCYIPFDFDSELEAAIESSDKEKTYEFPDGDITIGSERFGYPEVLFQPKFVGKDGSGIHDTTFQSSMKCDVGFRADMCANVVLSGFPTMFPGIDERVTEEPTAFAPSTMRIKLVAPFARKYLVWIGHPKGSTTSRAPQLYSGNVSEGLPSADFRSQAS